MLKIIDIFSQETSESEQDLEIVLSYFQAIVQTKSFTLTVRMLLKDDKKAIEQLLEKIELLLERKRDQVAELRKQYKITK